MSNATINNAATSEFVMCKEPACTVVTDGMCYEGLANPSQCPNYAPLVIGDDEIAALEADADWDAETSEPSREPLVGVPLFTGRELDHAGAHRIMLHAVTRVIVLAGPNDSGKTTLLASIFEHFLQGALAGYLFAGCETSPAFDSRCHLSRTDSGRRTEDTERTKSFSEQTMLHLRVRDEALLNPPRDLLLSDLRGELFNEAGFPPGVVNLLSGAGQTGSLLASHMKIAKISFTGSAATGRKVQEAATKSNLKKCTLELGGKSPALIFDDADIENALNQ